MFWLGRGELGTPPSEFLFSWAHIEIIAECFLFAQVESSPASFCMVEFNIIFANARTTKIKWTKYSFHCLIHYFLGSFLGKPMEWRPKRIAQKEENDASIRTRYSILNPRSNATTNWTERFLRTIAGKRRMNWMNILSWDPRRQVCQKNWNSPIRLSKAFFCS